MIGISGIVHRDGRPVDPAQLQALTDFIAFRGPDAQRTWSQGPVGFGHTLLRTTFESEHEQQPATLDGQVWITADARIDGWTALKDALANAGEIVAAQTTDAELILHAYRAWGENCVEHLIGDFAFAIWDGPRQQLFCARDHFGIKPFFYAWAGHALVFGNTLDCVRQHPEVSDELNDLAIADFLLFGSNQEPKTTSFASISRLPSGHALALSAQGLAIRRYWQPPMDRPIEHRSEDDCVEHFLVLLTQAVTDRLRTNQVGVELSGGLDSASVATVAHALRTPLGRSGPMYAQTVVYDRLIPDQERHYAALVADKLAIPIDYIVADDYRLFEHADRLDCITPEPNPDPVVIRSIESFRRASRHTRVMLTGWEGDGFLNESPKPYFRLLLREGNIVRLLREATAYGIEKRKFSLRDFVPWLRGRSGSPQAAAPAYPEWINQDLEQHLDLKERWQQVWNPPVRPFCVHPRALRTVRELAETAPFFEYYDAGQTGFPVEYRHPLLDLRLLDFCLSLPPFPWCIQKHVLRRAMQGRLPEPVRARPKAPLAGYPYVELLGQPESRWVDDPVAQPSLNRYVSLARVPQLFGTRDPGAAWANLRPLCLNVWLGNRPPKANPSILELAHDA